MIVIKLLHKRLLMSIRSWAKKILTSENIDSKLELLKEAYSQITHLPIGEKTVYD